MQHSLLLLLLEELLPHELLLLLLLRDLLVLRDLLLLLRELLLLLRREHKLLVWHRHQVVVRRESIQIIKSLRMSVIIPKIEIKALRKGILALPASTVHQSRTRGKQKKEEDSARNVR